MAICKIVLRRLQQARYLFSFHTIASSPFHYGDFVNFSSYNERFWSNHQLFIKTQLSGVAAYRQWCFFWASDRGGLCNVFLGERSSHAYESGEAIIRTSNFERHRRMGRRVKAK